MRLEIMTAQKDIDSASGESLFNPQQARTFGDALSLWFAQAARDLPWRRQRDGYRALVSEAMLQQTQVDRVTGPFERFLGRFPDVLSLAEGSEEDVLALWQGLGYYRRARLLHAAAQAIRDDHQGVIPQDAATLLTLPGVGRYTAGAIASIVFGERAPIVDGNVSRVLARFMARPGRPGERDFDAWCWTSATTLANHVSQPGVVNEAIMELGATVCRKHDPDCERCPLRSHCRGHASGEPTRFPEVRVRAKRTTTHHHVLVCLRTPDSSRNLEVLLVQRPEKGLWARMWQPPSLEGEKKMSRRSLTTGFGLPASPVALERVEHRTTHRDIVFHVHRPAEDRSKSTFDDACLSVLGYPRLRWHPVDRLDELGLSNPHRKMIDSAAGEQTSE
jgi:A/G-specific adenine glycosylase